MKTVHTKCKHLPVSNHMRRIGYTSRQCTAHTHSHATQLDTWLSMSQVPFWNVWIGSELRMANRQAPNIQKLFKCYRTRNHTSHSWLRLLWLLRNLVFVLLYKVAITISFIYCQIIPIRFRTATGNLIAWNHTHLICKQWRHDWSMRKCFQSNCLTLQMTKTCVAAQNRR